jgi:hypothetical protein
MISINYDTHLTVGSKVNVSIILDHEDFYYGICDDNKNLATVGQSTMQKLESFIENVTRAYKVLKMRYCSLSDLFIHVPTDDVPMLKENNRVEEFQDAEVAIIYDTKYHADIETKHFSTIINKEYFGKLGNVMHCHYRENKLLMYVATDGTMLFYNQFEIENEADCVYYMNLCMQTLKLNQEKLNIVLSGLIDVQSTIYKTISIYFQNIEFADHSLNISNEEKFKKSFYFDHYINLSHF